MPSPREAKVKQIADAAAARAKFRTGKKRIDYMPGDTAARLISSRRKGGESISAAIDRLLTNHPGVTGKEGKQVAELRTLEKKEGDEGNPSPEALLAAILEFGEHMGLPLQDAIAELKRRTVQRIAQAEAAETVAAND
jgi:hypothetical protein